MEILQNLSDFLSNPMGKGSTAIMQKQLILNDYKLRLEMLIKTKTIETNIYKDKDSYFIHVILPSESKRDNTYDVVLQFIPTEPNQKADRTLNRYGVKFFSNCPSFTFTFAHVFNQEGMMVDLLSDKYDKIVLEKKSEIRNPSQIISYEKSITLTSVYIDQDHQLMSKLFLDSRAKLNISELRKKVRNTDQIKLEISLADKEVKKQQKKEELESKKTNDTVTKSDKTNKITGPTKTKSTKNTINKLIPKKAKSKTMPRKARK